MASPRRLPASVIDLQRHDEGLFTAVMRPGGTVPPFRAGQFLHLALDPYDPSAPWPESRVFSIANAPARRDIVRITFSVKGAYTARMARELSVARTVWLKLPYGSFSLLPECGREMVLIAGGTGITPYISLLESVVASGQPVGAAPIRLFYGVRTPRQIIYGDILRECIQKLNDFGFHLFIEDPDDCQDWAHTSGRLDIQRIWNSVPDPSLAAYYLSGPLPMIRAFRTALTDHGIPPGNVRVDDWE